LNKRKLYNFVRSELGDPEPYSY